MGHSWLGWKMPLCKWHTLWMASWLICCFIMLVSSSEKFSFNISFEIQIEKLQRLNVINQGIEMLKYSWISKNFN